MLIFVAAIAAGLLAGCGSRTDHGTVVGETAKAAAVENQPPPAEGQAERKEFGVRGVVRKIHDDRLSAFIRHEEIPGYMAEMTMLLKVRDAAELDGIEAGDAIWFRMVVNDETHWIEDVKKTGTAPKTGETLLEQRLAMDTPPAVVVGRPLTDVPLVNQDGETVRLTDFKGRAFAMTFIFTRCPLPDYCPRMTRNFKAVREILAAREDLAAKWHLMSVSFDPENDTPAALRSYGAYQQARFDQWGFYVGNAADIRRLASPLGLAYETPAGGGPIAHNLRTLVVGPDGRVARIWSGNEWTAQEVVDALIAAMTK